MLPLGGEFSAVVHSMNPNCQLFEYQALISIVQSTWLAGFSPPPARAHASPAPKQSDAMPFSICLCFEGPASTYHNCDIIGPYCAFFLHSDSTIYYCFDTLSHFVYSVYLLSFPSLSTTMPRPGVKRSRLASKAPPANRPESPGNPEFTDGPESPSNASRSMASASKPTESASAPFAKQLRDQTPMSKGDEQVIESSPMGDRTATGSRPPTRRGYSSTLSLAGRKGDMSSKIPGTPAFENSVLSNFRKRARQPSILQMMQTEDVSSDLDDDDFLGGLSPEDESTPLNAYRGKSLLIRHTASSPHESSSPSSGGSRKRKRATGPPEELQVPQSPLGAAERTPTGFPARTIQGYEPTRTDASQQVEPLGVFSQTMVAPMSSSAPPSPGNSALAPVADRASPANSRMKEPNKKPRDLGHLSTANLQNKLLPRRRQRRRRQRDTTDLDLSSDNSEDGHPSAGRDDDDDELDYLPSRKPMRPQRQRIDRSSTPLANGRTKPVKPKNASKQTSTSHRAGEFDKENQPKNQPADMSSPLSSALDSDAFDSEASESVSTGKYMSEELRLQAKKFAEVDRWQMDFEDVPSVAGSQDGFFI